MSKKYRTVCFFVSAIIVFLSYGSASAGEDKKSNKIKTISEGMILPQFELNAPGSSEEQEYLGLKDLKPFFWSQISAKILVMEIFSFYCPHCRKQGPVLNKIYRFIQQDDSLANGIKMLGVAAGGDKSKVDMWKSSLHVPFPLFTDPDTSIWQKLGKPGVPCTLIVTIRGKVLAVHYGASEDTEDFFREIKKFYEEQMSPKP